jgi:ubiquinone/menaquinone biosynthesis C-methylase UbiE
MFNLFVTFYALLMVKIDIARFIEYPSTIKYLNPIKEDLILDIGCGSSCFPSFLCSHGPTVFAIDLDATSLKIQHAAMKNTSFLKGKFHQVVADARYLPFREETFTKITSISTVEHIPSRDNMVSVEIRRVLRDGGICVLSFPYSTSHKSSQLAPYFMRWYTDHDIEARIIKPSGLKLSNKYLFEKIYLGLFLGHESFIRRISVGYIFTHYFLGLFLHKLEDLFLKGDRNADGCLITLIKRSRTHLPKGNSTNTSAVIGYLS